MESNSEVYTQMHVIDWFHRGGMEFPRNLPIRCRRVDTLADALASAQSPDWQDARTEAQGQLTGYLAKHYGDAYVHWNDIAAASRERIQDEVMPRVSAALHRLAADQLEPVVLLDLNRIAIQSAYRRRYARVPDFLARLFEVYKRGHLPCGWVGDLDAWPQGTLLAY